MANGRSEAVVAGAPSAPAVPLPATVRIIPSVLISRTLPVSAKYRSPDSFTARRVGEQTLAALAGPLSPVAEQVTPPRPPLGVRMWGHERSHDSIRPNSQNVPGGDVQVTGTV